MLTGVGQPDATPSVKGLLRSVCAAKRAVGQAAAERMNADEASSERRFISNARVGLKLFVQAQFARHVLIE